MPLTNEIESPLFRALYTHLNQHTYELHQLEDPEFASALQNKLTDDLFEIYRPAMQKRPDLQAKYERADFRVHINVTPYEIRPCVKPCVLELSHDLMYETIPDYSKLRESFVNK